MANCLPIATMVLGLFGFIMLSISCGTRAWKEDIDFWKDQRTFYGLWQLCIVNNGESSARFPKFENCDKDYLRPQLVEPPRKSVLCYIGNC